MGGAADWSIRGTDVSSASLEEARSGMFNPNRLLEVPPALLHHFARAGRQMQISEGLRGRVQFARHDLLTAEEYPEADLILCRNVLIYFPRSEQERILLRLAAALPAGGYLVLGKTEILLGEVRRLFRVESAAERIYQRLRDKD
jgi:chemotaxis protein methyltransferase CheR